MAKVIYPPAKVEIEGPSVFTAGSIDMGKSEDWQNKLIEALKDVDCTVLNPRRKDWDKSWKQEMTNPKFREQVEWELAGQDVVDCIAMCFLEDSKAPISLMELGLYADSGKLIVCCPEGYWKKGNVDIVCAKYSIPVLTDFEEFVGEVAERMRTERIASRVAVDYGNRNRNLEIMRSVRKPMPPPTTMHERKDLPSRQDEKQRLRKECLGGQNE